MTVPDRIAMCTHTNGDNLHIPLSPDEPMPRACFQDCGGTPAEFVRVRETNAPKET